MLDVTCCHEYVQIFEVAVCEDVPFLDQVMLPLDDLVLAVKVTTAGVGVIAVTVLTLTVHHVGGERGCWNSQTKV